MVTTVKRAKSLEIILRPNRSLTWNQSKWLLIVFGGFCLSIAIAWSLVGAWLILPFAGIEIAALVLVTYLVSRGTYSKQRIFISRDLVAVQAGVDQIEQQHRLARNGCRLLTWQRRHPEDVRKLVLANKGKQVAIGGFLNLQDQEQLIGIFEDCGFTMEELAFDASLKM